MSIKTTMSAQIANLNALPKWRKYLYGTIALIGIVYLLWSLFWPHFKPSPGFNKMPPAVDTPKVPGPTLAGPVKIIPKGPVKRKFPTAPISEGEEWVDSVDIPSAPHGATVLTKIDTVTGEVTNVTEIKPSPWFAFQRTNTVEVYGMKSTDGDKIEADYIRDVVSIKDATVAIKVGGKVPLESGPKAEGHVGIGVKFKFDWP